MADSSDRSWQLTPQERARLRPVNVAALERFLAANPRTIRRAVIAHFARTVTHDDVVSFMREMHAEGNVSANDLAEFERAMDGAATQPDVGPEPRPPSDGLAFIPVPHTQFILQFDLPEDPALRRLWDAIEAPAG